MEQSAEENLFTGGVLGQALFHGTPFAVLFVGDGGSGVTMNSQAEELFGWKHNAVA